MSKSSKERIRVTVTTFGRILIGNRQKKYLVVVNRGQREKGKLYLGPFGGYQEFDVRCERQLQGRIGFSIQRGRHKESKHDMRFFLPKQCYPDFEKWYGKEGVRQALSYCEAELAQELIDEERIFGLVEDERRMLMGNGGKFRYLPADAVSEKDIINYQHIVDLEGEEGTGEGGITYRILQIFGFTFDKKYYEQIRNALGTQCRAIPGRNRHPHIVLVSEEDIRRGHIPRRKHDHLSVDSVADVIVKRGKRTPLKGLIEFTYNTRYLLPENLKVVK